MRTIGTLYPRLPFYSDWLTEIGNDSPYGWFKLNESTGNVLQAGSVGGSGTALGSSTGLTRNTTGLLTYSGNKAYTFNSSASAYTNLGTNFNANTLDLNNAVTFEGLFKFTNASTGNAFICGQNADSTGYIFNAQISGSGTLSLIGFVQSFFDTAIDVDTGIAVNTSDYFLCAYTFSTNLAVMYVNGREVSRLTLSSYTMGATTGSDFINLFSRFNGTFSQSRNSIIDEVMIYRTALSPTRIRAHAVVAGLYE